MNFKVRAPSRSINCAHRGEKTLAIVPLNENGTATLAIATLAPGTHALIAAYAGNHLFGHSMSATFNAKVGWP